MRSSMFPERDMRKCFYDLSTQMLVYWLDISIFGVSKFACSRIPVNEKRYDMVIGRMYTILDIEQIDLPISLNFIVLNVGKIPDE